MLIVNFRMDVAYSLRLHSGYNTVEFCDYSCPTVVSL